MTTLVREDEPEVVRPLAQKLKHSDRTGEGTLPAETKPKITGYSGKGHFKEYIPSLIQWT